MKDHYGQPDVNRLLKALTFQEADRVPHMEFWITSKPVYEYGLGRSIDYEVVDARVGEQSITPEHHVEFAQRLGMDAVACNFSWRPGNVFEPASDGTEHYVGGAVKTRHDLKNLDPPPPPLSNQLAYLERYLEAAQGTGVGVFANFTSFFDSAMLAIGVERSLYLFYDDLPFLEELMDILLEHQEKVVQAVCERYADDLAFVLVNDDIAHNQGLMVQPEIFKEIFVERMKRLIAPAVAKDKILVMHTDGKMDEVMPILYEIGFNAVHPVEPECNDIYQVKDKWHGRMAVFGNVPTVLLAYGTVEEIQAEVQERCQKLGPGGGYILGSSTSIMDGIPPENFVAMTQAVHKYGRYGSLSRAD